MDETCRQREGSESKKPSSHLPKIEGAKVSVPKFGIWFVAVASRFQVSGSRHLVMEGSKDSKALRVIKAQEGWFYGNFSRRRGRSQVLRKDFADRSRDGEGEEVADQLVFLTGDQVCGFHSIEG